jgi:cell division protein ZapA (FtsZ GTPase activity inhibitor)
MMIQIQSIAFTSYNLGLHCDYHYQAYGLMTKAGAEVLHIGTLLPAYAELVEMESSIVHRQTTYVSTEQLKAADKARDNAVGVVMKVIQAHCSTTIETKRTAAKALDAMIAPYKGMTEHAYRSETREVAGLLAVLNKEEAKAHIATLNLTEEVAALTEKNADFEAVFNKKLQEEVERLPQKDIDTEELRKQVDAKYAEIVQTVNAYAIVQPTEAIEAFIAQMNGLISLTKPGSSSGSSSGGSTGGSTDTEPEPTPDPEPTPEPDPTPTPDPDTGEEDDDEGGLAG